MRYPILVLLTTLVVTSLGIARVPELTDQEKTRIDELYSLGIVRKSNEARFMEAFKMEMKSPDRIDRATAYLGMSDFTFAVYRHRDALASIASCFFVICFIVLMFVQREWAIWLGAFGFVIALCFIPPQFPAYTFGILAAGPSALLLRWIFRLASRRTE